VSGAFGGTLKRELILAVRRSSDVLTPLIFFVLTGLLFTLGLEPEPNLLARVAPGVIWVAALMAALLGTERLFRMDMETGVLEQLALSPQPLAWLMAARLVGHWLTTGLPLVLIAPLMAAMLGLPTEAWGALLLGLLLGTPVLAVLGAIGAALTVSLRASGALLGLLVLPLAIPVLIFGARAPAEAMIAGGQPAPGLWLLAALLALAASLGPAVVALAVRISLE
jgi:heme exporter protein B